MYNKSVDPSKKQPKFDGVEGVEEAFGNFHVVISVLKLSSTIPVSLRVPTEVDSDDLHQKVGCWYFERLESQFVDVLRPIVKVNH